MWQAKRDAYQNGASSGWGLAFYRELVLSRLRASQPKGSRPAGHTESLTPPPEWCYFFSTISRFLYPWWKVWVAGTLSRAVGRGPAGNLRTTPFCP